MCDICKAVGASNKFCVAEQMRLLREVASMLEVKKAEAEVEVRYTYCSFVVKNHNYIIGRILGMEEEERDLDCETEYELRREEEK